MSISKLKEILIEEMLCIPPTEANPRAGNHPPQHYLEEYQGFGRKRGRCVNRYKKK